MADLLPEGVIAPSGMAGSRQTENSCLPAPKLWLCSPAEPRDKNLVSALPCLLEKYLRSFCKASQWGFGAELRLWESLC